METICGEKIVNGTDSNVHRVDYHKDQFLMHTLRHVPVYVTSSFSNKQLKWLKDALEQNNRESHALDYRGSIGLFNRYYYFVLLAGRDKRKSRRKAEKTGGYVVSFILACFLVMAALCWIVVMDIIFDMGISNALFSSI